MQWNKFEEIKPDSVRDILVSNGVDVFAVCYWPSEKRPKRKAKITEPSYVEAEWTGVCWLEEGIDLERCTHWAEMPEFESSKISSSKII
jgi:hypothetical protein